ncbi:MAG: hypothetical protein AAF557_24730 [Pseudomonadota bacterium]
MTRQKPSNPLKAPDLPERFAALIAKHMVRLKLSDDGLLDLLKKAGPATKGSLASIRRYKEAKGGNPTAQTIGTYAEALDFSPEELDSLTGQSTPPPVDHDLIAQIREEMDLATDGLLENLAQRFGIDNPDAPRAQLYSYLKDKAKEWKALKARFGNLAEQDERFSNHIVAALDWDSNRVLEKLAQRFGVENPNAPGQKLEAFLKDKSKELRALQARLANLNDFDERLSNQMVAAEDALSRGDFDEAEEILSAAEEVQQQECTLAEVRKQSQIRATRAEAALLKGDQDEAFGHFKTSANMFAPFDPLESAKVRRNHYLALYQNGLNFPGPALSHAATLARINLVTYAEPVHAEMRGVTLGNLAIFLGVEGKRKGGPAGEDLQGQAVQAHRDALKVYTRDEMPTKWATAQHNLANTLQEQGSRTAGSEGRALLLEAIEAYQETMQIRTRTAMPVEWAMTQTSRGNALLTLSMRTKGPESVDLRAKAVQAFHEALLIRTREAMPTDWAMTRTGLGDARLTESTQTSGRERADLLAQAIDIYRDVLSVFTWDETPNDWAMTQHNLGNALQKQGEFTTLWDSDAALTEALKAYRESLLVRTRANLPAQWAATQVGLGEALETIAERGAVTKRRAGLLEALEHLDAALEVYDPSAMSFHFDECSKARDRVAAKLAGTWVEDEGSD